MYSQTIQPRFNETDALGHINNTVVAAWFEGCRDPLFRLFTPDLNPAQWRLILAKFSVDFHAELFYGEPVEIKTWVSRIGNSSFDVSQQAWQQGQLCASGVAVMVHFDFGSKQSATLSDELKARLLAL
ncbi:MAG: acyl-CoA thioesterase [Gammaproteobacteria bacterium]|jgi:acyl-CoA thioester hydrolase|nr:acyl-CoA thioesterase [Gammaproteobacteria bacterium]MBU2279588.1 acyl-CoA thioesterase [Gammaproteobacteria bacterium]